MKSFSHVWFVETPWTIAYQPPPSMEFSRQKYWSGLPFPSLGDLPEPGMELGSATLQADTLPSEPQGSHFHEYNTLTYCQLKMTVKMKMTYLWKHRLSIIKTVERNRLIVNNNVRKHLVKLFLSLLKHCWKWVKTSFCFVWWRRPWITDNKCQQMQILCSESQVC